MGKYKYLLKNIGLLTLSSFATKFLSFFLVPLYTNVLSTTEYGTYDLFNTTIGVLLPILTVNIHEAVLRFLLDKNNDRQAVTTVGARYFFKSNCIVAIGLLVNYTFGFSELGKEYAVFFFLMYFAQSLSAIVMAYIRGVDRVADLSISSVVCSAVIIGCNILFLLVFKWGLVGYFLANIFGPIAQCAYLITRAHAKRDINLKEKYPHETGEMLAYSKPMIANSVAWWINNASDKYIVTFVCGLAENGVYSVASKIPSIMNIFQTIFAQAWTLSAVKDFDPEDKNGFFANTYAAYNCLMVFVCSAIIITDKFLAKFLYAKNFYSAWQYVPWLTIAIVFGSLSGYIGGFFSAVKDSKQYAQSTIIGAGTNIILNFILTPLIGALGAAIATTVCYWVTWIFRFVQSKKYIKLSVNIVRDSFSYVILVAQAVALLVTNGVLMYAIEIGLFVVIALLYIKDILSILNKGLCAIGRK